MVILDGVNELHRELFVLKHPPKGLCFELDANGSPSQLHVLAYNSHPPVTKNT